MKSVALSMFRKNFFGIFHGSISARVEQDQFIINKKNAIFDNLETKDFIKLYSKKDLKDLKIGLYLKMLDFLR